LFRKETRNLYTNRIFLEKREDLVRVDDFFGRQKKPNMAKKVPTDSFFFSFASFFAQIRKGRPILGGTGKWNFM